MRHDDYALLGAIVFSPWQTKVNSHHTFPIHLYGERPYVAKIAGKPIDAGQPGFQSDVSTVRDVALGVGRLALACMQVGRFDVRLHLIRCYFRCCELVP